MKVEPTHYDVLEVARNASEGVIRAAYRSLSQKNHPDLNARAGAATRMKAINAAYAVLSDRDRRTAYDRTLESAPLSQPMGPPVPATGWGRAGEGRLDRFVHGWTEYAIENDTGDHAWVGLSGAQGRWVRTVFIRSGDTAGVVIAARPVAMTVALGRVWDHESQAFAPEHRLWRTHEPIRPPGARLRLDMGLNQLARLGRMETLEPRVEPTPLPVWGERQKSGSLPALLAVGATLMLALALWGAFMWRFQEGLLAASLMGVVCSFALFYRWSRSGHRKSAGLVAFLSSAAVWVGGGWLALSYMLTGNGWNWEPAPLQVMCWLLAGLGPPALAWHAWALRRLDEPKATWGWLTIFSGAATASLWGTVFGWGSAGWKALTGAALPTASLWASSMCLAVAWASASWVLVLVLAHIITALGDRDFNPWTRAYWRLLTAWALLPVIAAAAVPHLSLSWWRDYLAVFVRAIP